MSGPESAQPVEDQEEVARDSRATGGDAPAAGTIREREHLAERDVEDGEDGDGESGDGEGSSVG